MGWGYCCVSRYIELLSEVFVIVFVILVSFHYNNYYSCLVFLGVPFCVRIIVFFHFSFDVFVAVFFVFALGFLAA